MKAEAQHKEEFLAEIRALGFDEGFLDDYYDMLLQGRQPSVSWQEYQDFENGRMLLEPELILAESNLPYLYGYRATLLETHPIHHGIYGGIDTQVLENRLKEGEWSSGPAVHSELFAQTTELALSGNKIAKDISQRLEARYWIGTSAAQNINVDWLLKCFGKTHYFSCDQKGLNNVSIIQAYNLISGRPVLHFEQTSPNAYTGYWFGLKRLQKPLISKDKEPVWFEEKRYPGFDPFCLLELSAIKEMKQADLGLPLFRQLLSGNIAAATVMIGGKEQPCRISADAENNRLFLRDDHGVEICIRKGTLNQERKSIKKISSQKKNKRNGI